MSATRASVVLRAEDPRDFLRLHDRYSAQPQSIREWFYTKRLGAAAEWIYWLLWDRSCMTGSYTVAMSICEMASRIGVSESTALRAVQALMNVGALRRTRRAKSKDDPFREEVALTEVLVPPEVTSKLRYMQSRGKSAPRQIDAPSAIPSDTTVAQPAESPEAVLPPNVMRMVAEKRITIEEGREWLDWKTGKASSFTPKSTLTERERALLLDAEPRYLTTPTAEAASKPAQPTVPRRTATKSGLDLFSAERLRRRISQIVPLAEIEARFHEMTWSLQFGSLSRKDSLLHGVNLGLKLLSNGAWQRPLGMPAKWTCTVA